MDFLDTYNASISFECGKIDSHMGKYCQSYIIKPTMGKKNSDDTHRKTGKDKAKDTYSKYGKYTNKHIRMMEDLKDKHQTPPRDLQKNTKV